jgi:phosphotriesterase-related protein
VYRLGDPMWDRGSVLTTAGPIAPEEVGIALTHEHIFADLSKYYVAPEDPVLRDELRGPVRIDMLGYLRLVDYWNEDNLVLDDYELALDELRRFRRLGGRTVCDVSSRGIRVDRMIGGLRLLSTALGLNIVVGTGCYIAAHHEAFVAESSIEELADLFVREILEGIGHSGVRAGVIGEIGLSTPPEAAELKVLKAAGRAHVHTGAPIIIHQSDLYDYQVPSRALDLLEQEGVRAERVVIAHSGFGEDLRPLATVARRGAYVAFDHFGMSGYERDLNWQLPQELDYVKRVMELVDAGYIERLLLSHDVCNKIHLRRYGGHGYDHLLGIGKSMFLRAGLSDSDYELVMMKNPARLLTITR